MRKLIIISIACIALSACTAVDRGFGETVHRDSLAQTVNPEGLAPSPGAPMEGGYGIKGDTAVDRYEKGTVKEPVHESSQVSVGGAGSSTR
jgi:hypothetical protein